jgi:hypothetical protein
MIAHFSYIKFLFSFFLKQKFAIHCVEFYFLYLKKRGFFSNVKFHSLFFLFFEKFQTFDIKKLKKKKKKKERG